jgi:DNA invertase Pin-like site-specific DNA recombinase
MKSQEIIDAVRTLRAQGRSLHGTAKLLRLSRNTVRRILREPQAPSAPQTPPCQYGLRHLPPRDQ